MNVPPPPSAHIITKTRLTDLCSCFPLPESPDGDADDDGGDPTWDAGPEGSGQLSDIEDKPTVKQEAPGDQSDDGDPDEPVAPRRRRGRPARARTLRKRRQVPSRNVHFCETERLKEVIAGNNNIFVGGKGCFEPVNKVTSGC